MKTIQISTSIDSVGKYLVLALCDDGTIWKLSGLYEGKPCWEPFPSPSADDVTIAGLKRHLGPDSTC